MLIYIILFCSGLLLSIFCTVVVKKIAKKFDILDYPNKSERKIHKTPIPLLGGMAIYVSFFLVLFTYFIFFHNGEGNVTIMQLIGLFISCTILIGVGIGDDKFDLSPKLRLLFFVIAVLTAIGFGIGIEKITNPLGGIIDLSTWSYSYTVLGKVFYFTVIADIFTFLWLLGMMNTTKILDGLDGLATGITAIGALIIFFLSISDKYYQSDVSKIAILFLACCLGFLIFNFNPAKIYLGEGGSLIIGFILGVLAIISGSKVATALLIMGVPILDVAWAIFRRIRSRRPISKGDKLHLHHRLLDVGFTQKQAVLLFYAISFSFGISTLFLQNLHKLFLLGFLVILMIVTMYLLLYIYKQKRGDYFNNQ